MNYIPTTTKTIVSKIRKPKSSLSERNRALVLGKKVSKKDLKNYDFT